MDKFTEAIKKEKEKLQQLELPEEFEQSIHFSYEEAKKRRRKYIWKRIGLLILLIIGTILVLPLFDLL